LEGEISLQWFHQVAEVGQRRAKKRAPARATNGSGVLNGTAQAVTEGNGEVVLADVPSVAMLRPASIGLFHALGKILWNKRIPPDEVAIGLAPPSKKRKQDESAKAKPMQLPHEYMVPKSQRPPLYFQPEEVLKDSASDPSMIVEWLFTNAPRFYGDVEDLADFSATLTTVDTWDRTFGSAWDDFGAAVQARGVLDANLHPMKPTFGDPADSAASSDARSVSFNMVRPLLRDIGRHRLRRSEMLAASMAAMGPYAFGVASAGPTLLVRTLPFVDFMMRNTRGQHRTLQRLPATTMNTIIELNSFHGTVTGRAQEKWGAQIAEVWNSTQGHDGFFASSLQDDPIEDDSS
jgi:hypothetical protein